jgi:calcium-dependent protein kinase
MTSIDLDGNGYIDYNEFLSATINRDKILNKQNLELAFKTFDRDGSGKISIDEIQQIFSNTTVTDKSIFENMVKELDQNGDGEISYEEFKDIMTKFFQ